MKTSLTPQLPLTIDNNQYGYSPCKTYYYIKDANGLIFHQKDKKWRKHPLKELTTHIYRTETSAQTTLNHLTIRFTNN